MGGRGTPPQKRTKRKPIVTTIKPPAIEPPLPRKRDRAQITLTLHIPLPGLMHDIFRTPTADLPIPTKREIRSLMHPQWGLNLPYLTIPFCTMMVPDVLYLSGPQPVVKLGY